MYEKYLQLSIDIKNEDKCSLFSITMKSLKHHINYNIIFEEIDNNFKRKCTYLLIFLFLFFVFKWVSYLSIFLFSFYLVIIIYSLPVYPHLYLLHLVPLYCHLSYPTTSFSSYLFPYFLVHTIPLFTSLFILVPPFLSSLSSLVVSLIHLKRPYHPHLLSPSNQWIKCKYIFSIFITTSSFLILVN